MEVGKSGLTVSRISMGTLPMGGESVWGDCDNQESIRTIHASRACGINFFDTAPAYGFGRSEDFCVKPGDARSRILWYQPERRKKVLCMLASWEDLWKKYKCSPAALNLAWMLAQAPNVNVDAGSRKAKNMETNAAGGSITLEAEDLNRMNQDIALLHRQYQTQGNQEHP